MGGQPIILVATSNRGKLAELRAILADLPVRLASLADFPPMTEPVEDACTFAGNAEIKARHYARLAGCWALADDSGLEVDALNGAPGVHSARFAGPSCDPAANNAKLVAVLAGIPAEDRSARFRCALALADSQGVIATAQASFEGVIVDDPRGQHGFGYDPHFLIPSLGKTAAELIPAEKNRISHRGQAFRSMRGELEKLLAGTQSD